MYNIYLHKKLIDHIIFTFCGYKKLFDPYSDVIFLNK